MLDWIKRNRLATFLLILLLFLLIKQRVSLPFISQLAPSSQTEFIPLKSIGGIAADTGNRGFYPKTDYAPVPEVKDRLVIQNSSLSLLVKNVRETATKIIEWTKGNGGYMVTSFLENPAELATGTVVVRIPSVKLTSALDYLRGLAVKVVSENLVGEDVTDEYEDLEARLTTLKKTKAKFEEILDKAVQIQDILNAQREIINLQSQIDSIIGQQKYLEKSAQMAKVTVYLSTDELALPYAPSETWRPNVIFKLAVRSLVSNVRQAGTALIWLGVYAVFWVPALIVFLLLKNKFWRN